MARRVPHRSSWLARVISGPAAFERWGRWLTRHPIFALGFCLIVTSALAFPDDRRLIAQELPLFEASGAAILTSSNVLGPRFATFALSPMENLASFGQLTALSIALALVTDVRVLPAMLRWVFSTETRRSQARAGLAPSTRISTPSA